jgi:hypothetical protein
LENEKQPHRIAGIKEGRRIKKNRVTLRRVFYICRGGLHKQHYISVYFVKLLTYFLSSFLSAYTSKFLFLNLTFRQKKKKLDVIKQTCSLS